MFKSKTLFVVGAGASKEAGLPTGKELTSKIAEKLNIRFESGVTQVSGDKQIVYALRQHERTELGRVEINDYLHAGRFIASAMPQAMSIDSFIDAHQGDEKIELCGKLAIVQSILEAEYGSLLAVKNTDPAALVSFRKLEKTWYNIFMQLIMEGCRRTQIDNIFANVSFIIFNYDRCIEHYIYNSLQNYYGISGQESAELIRELEIYHPYGVVGRLPWQQSEKETVAFGDDSAEHLLPLAGQIKTFTERIEEEETVTAMRQLAADAETIVFLGFAFHEQNMDLLRSHNTREIKRIFATGRGISNNDCEVIRKTLSETLKGAYHSHRRGYMEMQTGTECHELFSQNWRSISS